MSNWLAAHLVGWQVFSVALVLLAALTAYAGTSSRTTLRPWLAPLVWLGTVLYFYITMGVHRMLAASGRQWVGMVLTLALMSLIPIGAASLMLFSRLSAKCQIRTKCILAVLVGIASIPLTNIGARYLALTLGPWMMGG